MDESDNELPLIVEWRPICQWCIHHVARTCSAFPDQIPDQVWEGRDHHLKVLKGQKGTDVFTPDAAVAEQLREEVEAGWLPAVVLDRLP